MKLKQFNLGLYETNCYLAYDNEGKGLMFDIGGENLDNLKDFVQKNNIAIKYLILTHGHYDHISGLNAFHEYFPETEILVNGKEAVFLTDSSYSLSKMIDGKDFKYLGDFKTFNDGDSFEGFQAISTPGHTGGSTCFYNKDIGTLISGDTMFRRSFGRTDLPTSNTEAIFISLKNLCDSLPLDTKVYSAHTESTTIGEEKQFLTQSGYIS
ncbi:MAG: MBL fold metallo-hydrolase [Fusobacteriaceae bacterium]